MPSFLRGRNAAVLLGIMAGAAMLLLFAPERYGFYPRCPFHEVTGLLCPGCGGTRALAALLRGHVSEAMRWNALVTSAGLLLIPGCTLFGVPVRVWPRWIARVRLAHWQEPVALGVLLIALVFTVWRNFG